MVMTLRQSIDQRLSKQMPTDTRSRTGQVGQVVEAIRRNQTYLDYVLGFALLLFALFGTRVLHLQYQEQLENVAKVRPAAEAAAAMTGKTAEGGQKLLGILNEAPPPFHTELAFFLAVLSSAPIAFRRRSPELVHFVVFFTFVASMWFVPTNAQVSGTLVWISTYFFAAHARLSPRIHRAILFAGAVVALLLVSSIIQNRTTDPTNVSARDKTAYVIYNGVFFGSAIALGLLIRRFKSSLTTLQRQTETLKAQQAELERTATLNERVRIAREVHDVVAHHVSVMGMHAGAARMTLGSAPSPIGASLETIERASRDAVTDLHRLLSFLRSDESTTSEFDLDISSPQPNLESLPALFDNHRKAGFGVTPRISADLHEASPVIELAAYRIIQEALTNIRKHGHKTDESVIDIWSDSDWLRIRVENIPATHRVQVGQKIGSAGSEPGHGVQGMRERTVLHGGEFSASATSDGGFVVRAVLPLRG
jgi:signal transduction histidine kinase